MISPPGSLPTTSRRGMLVASVAILGSAWPDQALHRVAASSPFERETIASVLLERGVEAPLTLGMARVVLRPGASTWAAIPSGVRVISVESGMIGVAVGAPADEPITAADFTVSVEPAEPSNELLVPAGSTMVFSTRGIASVRNPGTRAAVVLDAVIIREEPRPLARAFTTASGVSFQLLASANAGAVPLGALLVTLERLRLAANAMLPAELSGGLTLMYVEAGAFELVVKQGGVSSARAAASAPYAVPGALQLLAVGERRSVTAGGVVFLEESAAADLRNAGERAAEVLALSVREAR